MGVRHSAGEEYESIRRSTVKQYFIFLFKQWAFSANCPSSLETPEDKAYPCAWFVALKACTFVFILLIYCSVLL